jgi:hypothetical protein
MEYTFRSTGADRVLVGQVVDGVWSFTLTGATTVGWTYGPHTWDLSVVRLSDSEKAIVASGYINFLRAADDRRSTSEIMLSKIESILLGRADSDVESYTIGSRSISKIPLDELMKWRDYYRSEVSREQAGGKTPTLRVRFIK